MNELAIAITLEANAIRYDISEVRRETLACAIELGASLKALKQITEAVRVKQAAHIVLPALRYENLSRGRGWARKGRGDDVTWGERCDKGYRVTEEGRWIVGATDGFSRKDSCAWDVKFIQVGNETWTIAS